MKGIHFQERKNKNKKQSIPNSRQLAALVDMISWVVGDRTYGEIDFAGAL